MHIKFINYRSIDLIFIFLIPIENINESTYPVIVVLFLILFIKVVWSEYGNYLMEKRYFDDAGLVFTQCGEHAKALLAYKESVNWQMALCSAGNLGFTKKDTMSLCEELSSKC